MTIFAYQRFINWKLIRRQRPDGSFKDDKVPWDYAAGHEINPHDPKYWRTYQDAASINSLIGFVIVETDPFFFLDLDKCRVGDGWHPTAAAIFNAFAGAGAEISQSGNGLHVIGTCDKALLADRRNRFGKEWRPDVGLWCEFYIKERFVALGPYGFTGDFMKDCTQAILSIVPKRETTAEVLASGPSADYTGPADDEELLRKALNSKSLAGTFGAKALFSDLWDASNRADMMMQHFPSSTGDVFDRSAADAALMQHLAFWTGRDAARMDRLFRRSGLMRPKYAERQDYRENTILNACRSCKKVYDYIKPVEEQPEALTPAASGEFLSIAEQVEYFKGCVYVSEAHAILIPGGRMLSPPKFNAMYGGKRFVLSSDNTGATSKAFEAFTENRAYAFPKVHATCFRPKATPGALIDGRVNVYSPFHPVTKPGDASPFVDHLRRLLPDPNDFAILMAYMAALVQNPGSKLQWCPVIQGAEGNGKTVITECLEYVVGMNHSHRPSASDLANPFNSYLENKLLIAVEEVKTDDRRELLEILKPLITNDRIEIQPKGVDKRMIDNFANWIMLTNHADAIPKTIDDRRYAIFFTKQQNALGIVRDGMSGNYFPDLYRWLRERDGKAIVANYLLTYDVPDELNPVTTLHRAPATSTTPMAIHISRGKAEQLVLEAVASEQVGFRGGWISSYSATIMLREHGIKLAPVKLGQMIESLGYAQIGRAEKPLMSENLQRPMLYRRVDLITLVRLGADDYAQAQGYRSDGYRMPGNQNVTFPGNASIPKVS